MRRIYSLLLGTLVIASGCAEILLPEPTEEATSNFINPLDGVYVLVDDSGAAGDDGDLARLTNGIFSPLTIKGDVVRYGKLMVGEFQLMDPAFKGNTLRADAYWHEDVNDPGDMTEVTVELKPSGKTLTLTIYEEGEEGTSLTYKRRSS